MKNEIVRAALPAASSAQRGSETKAFTLIELLVVTAILAVVVGAIGACLAGGIRVWDVARRFNRDEADVLMGFQVMRRDMGGMVDFEAAPFKGEPDWLEFTGISIVPGVDEREGAGLRLARIRYYLDRDQRAWCRAVSLFSWGAEKAPEMAEILVSGVDDVDMHYAEAPEDDSPGASGWSDVWDNPTNLPGVVEAELSVGGTVMTQWFLVPLAGGGE